MLAGIEDEKHNHQNEANCHRDDKHRGTLDIILLRKVYKLAPPDFHPVDRVGVDAPDVDSTEQMEIRSMRMVEIVNLPLTAGRARKGFKPRVWGGRGFKAISRVAQTHVSGCVITAMFRTSPSGS